MNITIEAFARTLVSIATDELCDMQEPSELRAVIDYVRNDREPFAKHLGPLFLIVSLGLEHMNEADVPLLFRAIQDAWDEYEADGIDYSAPPC